jgi:hypothetical protein
MFYQLRYSVSVVQVVKKTHCCSFIIYLLSHLLKCSFSVALLLLQGQFLHHDLHLLIFCFMPFLALCIINQPSNWNRPEMSKTALRNKKRREKQKEKKAGEGSSADDS